MESVVGNFFKDPKVKKLGKIYHEQVSLENEFDVLSVFDDLINENTWSRVFAYLLDSNKPHNLGISFFIRSVIS